MAKYKNREVVVVQEMPHAQGDQVLIEHKELLGQTEIVPLKDVVFTKAEKDAVLKAREVKVEQEFKVEEIKKEKK